jgi:hypothetical protein
MSCDRNFEIFQGYMRALVIRLWKAVCKIFTYMHRYIDQMTLPISSVNWLISFTPYLTINWVESIPYSCQNTFCHDAHHILWSGKNWDYLFKEELCNPCTTLFVCLYIGFVSNVPFVLTLFSFLFFFSSFYMDKGLRNFLVFIGRLIDRSIDHYRQQLIANAHKTWIGD